MCDKGVNGDVTCSKFCVTNKVKVRPFPWTGYVDMMDEDNYQARVVSCFVSKTVKCTPAADGSKSCQSSVTANLKFDCPGKYSKHTARVLPDGSETKGFKSVCAHDDFPCQKEQCNTESTAALCLESMILS